VVYSPQAETITGRRQATPQCSIADSAHHFGPALGESLKGLINTFMSQHYRNRSVPVPTPFVVRANQRENWCVSARLAGTHLFCYLKMSNGNTFDFKLE